MRKKCRFWRPSTPGRDGFGGGRAPWQAPVLAVTFLIGLSEPAAAYIGPGPGLGAIGAFLGLLATVFVVLGVLVLWPIRRLLRRSANRQQAQTADAASATSPAGEPPAQSTSTEGDRSAAS